MLETRMRLLLPALGLFFLCCFTQAQTNNAARYWVDTFIETVKQDGLGPTVQARNFFHLSVAMYDAWSVYNDKATPFFLGSTYGDYTCAFDPDFPQLDNKDSAMNVAINYAAFRFMLLRFQDYSSKNRTIDYVKARFDSLGYDSELTTTAYMNGSPAALGNYIAEQLFEFGNQEAAGDEDQYDFLTYNNANPPLRPDLPGNPLLVEKNRWQPLALRQYIHAKGSDPTLKDWNQFLIGPEDIFLTPQWSLITPFAMGAEERSQVNRNGETYTVYHDPGPPPQTSSASNVKDLKAYQWNFALNIMWSSHLDPADTTQIDISPGALGKTGYKFPSDFADYANFYHFEKGGYVGKGHPKIPKPASPIFPIR